MAFLNGKAVAFSPVINIEHTEAKLQKKIAPLLIEGETVIKPAEGFDGISEMEISGVYYSGSGLPYTKKTKFKLNPEVFGEAMSHLVEAVICKWQGSGGFLKGLTLTHTVHTITFVEANCNILDYFGPFDSAANIIFESVSDGFAMDIWGEAGAQFGNVRRFEVFDGWCYDTSLYNAVDLEAEAIIELINNLATVEGKILWLGDGNIEKVSQDVINIAINKGWDVM
jgi:hypothetical protein